MLQIQNQFFQVTPEAVQIIAKNKLSGTEMRLWAILGNLDPFGDRPKQRPEFEELADLLGCNTSTIRRAFNSLVEIGLIVSQGKADFFSNGFANVKAKAKQASNSFRRRAKKFLSDQKCESKTKNSDSKVKNENLDANLPTKMQICENQIPDPWLSKDSSSLQTVQKDHKIQTFQIAKNPNEENQEDQKISSSNAEIKSATTEVQVKEKDKQEKNSNKVLSKSGIISKPKKQVKLRDLALDKSSVDASKPRKTNIPEELKEKLRELEIPLSRRVTSAITKHDISQAYAAAAHVENTWETITNPESIFLYQLPRQTIEKLGSRIPEIAAKLWAETEAINEQNKTPEGQKAIAEGMGKIRDILEKASKKKKL